LLRGVKPWSTESSPHRRRRLAVVTSAGRPRRQANRQRGEPNRELRRRRGDSLPAAVSSDFISDFHGPQWDAPDSEQRRPVRSLVICSTPRCGSTLLYTGLAAASSSLGTGVEWFKPAIRLAMGERWGCGDDLTSYVAALHARRTSADGVFAAKIHWRQLVAARAEAGAGDADPARYETDPGFLEWLFPAPLYVHLLRLDLDAQAVSLWMAVNSNVWHVRAGAERPAGENVAYSYQAIDDQRRDLASLDTCWGRLLVGIRAELETVLYEHLCSDYDATIERVARRLLPDLAVVPRPPLTERVAGETSAALLARYRGERAAGAARTAVPGQSERRYVGGSMAPSVRVLREFHGPEHDAPPAEQRRPQRSLVLCSTPRCGSEMLYSGLAATGRLGTALEWLNPTTRAQMSERWGCDATLDSYIDALHARRTTRDGLFAAKVHWEHLVAIRAEAGAGSADRTVYETPPELLERLFPAALYVRVIRLDLDEQAVSHWRAVQTNVWSVRAGEEVPDRAFGYSFSAIDRLRGDLACDEACWERLLRTTGNDEDLVVYEEMCADFPGTIERIAGRLLPGVAVAGGQPLTTKLRDASSEWLLQRYRRDRVRRR
jgi:LPS sulfotransferase NodH